MKVLLDEDLDHRLRKCLSSHEIFTVDYLGWAGLKNGELLKIAELNGIEVLVTGDQNLSYQQNFNERSLALVVLSATNWPIIKNHLSQISAAIDKAVAGSFQAVECGRFSRKQPRESPIQPEPGQEEDQEPDRER